MESRRLLSLWFVCFVLQGFHDIIEGDVYLHMPRGSNNRLNGNRANRRNGNRVFDSQNNAKGGYNAPEKTKDKTTDWFHEQYYMSGPKGKTKLTIEWTNQHGCGDDDLSCNIVLQYKCQPMSVVDESNKMRNGKTTSRQGYRRRRYRDFNTKKTRKDEDVSENKVLNEPWEWYDKCRTRKRNGGLFTADQKLRGDRSIFTRQNPKGIRRGYECPEERDYYPYWHPTDWIDIGVLVQNENQCGYYRKESFNVKAKGECLELDNNKKDWSPNNPWRHASQYNNRDACEEKGGKWVEFSSYLEINDKEEKDCTGDNEEWGIPYRSEDIDQKQHLKKCLVKPGPPECRKAPYSRSNHLGNGKEAVPLTFDWNLPYFPSGEEQRCVLRIRYNISTFDYNISSTDSKSNNDKNVIANDPEVTVGEDPETVSLQLAINTAQFGRTFQDRSHVFELHPRGEYCKGKTIYNLGVRGKRGNIVQVYPAVEYDFTRKRLEMKADDCLHIMWSGSNSNPNGNAGEGKAGTDRSNIVAMESPGLSKPISKTGSTMFDKAKVIHCRNSTETKTGADLLIAMATAGRFKSVKDLDGKNQKVGTLDDSPPSYTGCLVQFPPGEYYYMCSRNNNFSNRSQKGRLTVVK